MQFASGYLGIYELENPDILEFDSLRSLRDLVIISDKRVLNLEYFKAFSQLEHLRFFYPAKASGGIVRSGIHDLQKQSGSGNTRFLIKDGFSKLEHLNIHGSLSVIVDGAELLSVSLEGDQRHEPNMSSIYLEQGNELTITIKGNVKLWNVGFREMTYS